MPGYHLFITHNEIFYMQGVLSLRSLDGSRCLARAYYFVCLIQNTSFEGDVLSFAACSDVRHEEQKKA